MSTETTAPTQASYEFRFVGQRTPTEAAVVGEISYVLAMDGVELDNSVSLIIEIDGEPTGGGFELAEGVVAIPAQSLQHNPLTTRVLVDAATPQLVDAAHTLRNGTSPTRPIEFQAERFEHLLG